MDILKFLIIVAIIAIPIIKEARKNKTKSSGKPAPIPIPKDVNPVEAPIPKREKVTPPPKVQSKKKSVTPTISAPPHVLKGKKEKGKESEIAIRSAEDARKAIIWSEILNRKY